MAKESVSGVSESALNMSLGAGIANQIKFGTMTAKNSTSPRHSKPKLYFRSITLPPHNSGLSLSHHSTAQAESLPRRTPCCNRRGDGLETAADRTGGFFASDGRRCKAGTESHGIRQHTSFDKLHDRSREERVSGTIVTGSEKQFFADEIAYRPLANPRVPVDSGLALRHDGNAAVADSLRTVAKHLARIID
ncbi:hypothetical protein [Slackia heliotrinireducens]|uniref:hypothetical protein n=1 Tax=Slackia heliotrinireducens TaxID=84110 RepID=UPI0033145669